MSDDMEFMLHIISEICDYAKRNDMNPTETLVTVADTTRKTQTRTTKARNEL